MGTSYGNITLWGPSQSLIVERLRILRQQTYVSPTVGGFTVVYPLWCTPELAAQLSKDFVESPALFAYVSDSDYLKYYLYKAGDLLDTYFSDSWYDLFPDKTDLPHLKSWPSSGGDASLLCKLFGVPDAAEAVDTILRATDYVFAEDLHENLVRTLRMPLFASRLGFYEREYGYLWSEAGNFAESSIRT